MSSNGFSRNRAEQIAPFGVMDLVRRAAELSDAIHFEVGEPDLPPPPGVVKALERLPGDAWGYTPSAGLRALREKVARWYEGFYGLKIDVERIFITPGSSLALLAAYWLALDREGRLVLGDPGYPCYDNFARLQALKVRHVPLSAENDYTLNPNDLRKGDVAVHIVSPANPTGGFYDNDRLERLASACRALGIRLISDELYHGLWYDRKPQSALTFDDRAIVTGGFSKSFCMPGLRLGWIVVPDKQIDAMEKLAQNLYLCAPTPMQYAALEAFDENYLEFVRTTYLRRRDWLVERLERLFGPLYRPKGAFYVWCDVSNTGMRGSQFCEALLQSQQVVATPGDDFGESGRNFVRFAFTRDTAHMAEGVRRLERFLADL